MNQSPPGPRDWFFGFPQVRQIRADPLGYYDRLARQYGDIVSIRFGPIPAYVYFHPDQIKEVLITRARQIRRFRRPLDVLAQWNGKHSVIVTEGDEWLRQRRLAQPAFHPRRFGKYGEVVAAVTERWLQQRQQSRGQAFDVAPEMTDLALAIGTRTLFGVDVAAEAPRIGEAINVLSPIAVREFTQPFTLPDWLPLPGKARKRWAIRYLDDTVRGIIRHWRAEGQDHGDLLSMFMLAVDEEGDGRSMTDEEARDSLVTMLLAGHDTTAAGLMWIWYVLATHLDVEARVAAEVDATLGTRRPTADDLPRLTYTAQVVKETLRLYPPVPILFTRQAMTDLEIGGYRVRKGSLLQMFPWVTQRDPRWFVQPEKFDPDRFAPGQAEQLPQFAYFPFGGGPRVCIGSALAMMTMTLVTATVMQRLRLRLAPDQGPVGVQVLMSLRPRGEFRMVATQPDQVAAGAKA
jgi:cytochrome P450